MEKPFTEVDLERIRDAISRAEASHAGEIVPYIVGRVDDHEEARWRGATIGALMASFLERAGNALDYIAGHRRRRSGVYALCLSSVGEKTAFGHRY